MNVLMLLSTPIPPCEGIGSHVIGLAKRLRDRGHEITLMTRGNWRRTAKSECEDFRVIKVPFHPVYPFHVHLHRYFVNKTMSFFSPRPDLIHAHSPLIPPVLRMCPVVTTFHTPMLTDSMHVENISLKTHLMKLMSRTTSYHIEKKLIRLSDAIITVSQSVADELTTHYKVPKNKLHTITNTVDVEYYEPASDSQNQKILLYVGRLGYRKGLFELIRSAPTVIKRHPDIRYILVGAGPLKNLLIKEVKQLNIMKNFNFVGEVRNSDAIRDYYRKARAVLIPSHYEGFPMVLAEAMACGKPIVTTTAGFTKGILEDNSNALLVRPKCTEELAYATSRLLSSHELCKKLGRNARKTVVEKMNPRTNTDKVEEVYEQTIRQWNQRR